MLEKKTCKTLRLITAVTIAALSASIFATGASAQDVDAKAMLERMSKEIAGLDRFIVYGDAYADARLEAGQIIQHASQVTLRLQRDPGSVRITNRNAESTKEIFLDDGLLTVYNSSDNFYAQTDIPKGLESMLDFAVNDIGVVAPLLDFVSSNLANDLLQDANEVSYLGESLIRDGIYHHIGIRSAEVDVQIWINSEGRPLPGKLAISSKWEGGSPRFVAFFTWDTNLSFSPELFRFDPPDEAVEIDFLVDLQE